MGLYYSTLFAHMLDLQKGGYLQLIPSHAPPLHTTLVRDEMFLTYKCILGYFCQIVRL